MAVYRSMNIKLIRAFIASPSGLENERRIARAVAKDVNDNVAQALNGRLELIGWEETISGIGRPQALINEDMETCDIFIGVLWTKWGTRPAVDGPYTSGFEEEFELSFSRYNNTNTPIMTLFFKDIDSVFLTDPGLELKKVIEFKKRIQQEKILLYDTFSSDEIFADKIRAFLTRHAIKLLQQSSSTVEVRSTELNEPPVPISSLVANFGLDERDELSSSESKFLSAIAKSLDEQSGPSSSAIARIRLIAAFLKRPENDKLRVGVHDANLLYHERHSFELSHRERQELIYTGLANINDENVPIWTWLAHYETNELQSMLGVWAVIEEEEIVVGAIEVMRLLHLQIKPVFLASDVDENVGIWLSKKRSRPAKIAALKYLRDHGHSQQLPLIREEAALADSGTITQALEAIIAIYIRDSAVEGAKFVIATSFERIDENLLGVALDSFAELETEVLMKGLDHRSALVRARAIEVLSARSMLSLDTVERAKDDDDASVRVAALRALERLGQRPSIDEARRILERRRQQGALFSMRVTLDRAGEAIFETYLMDRLRHMPEASVEALLDSNSEKHAAYLTLAARGVRDFAERLRGDLADNFSGYAAQHWPNGIKANPLTLSLLEMGAADPLASKRRELVRQALDIVVSRRDKTDLGLVRQVLDSNFVDASPAVCDFLGIFGGADDVERIGRSSGSVTIEKNQIVHIARKILMLNPNIIYNIKSSNLSELVVAKILEILPDKLFKKFSDMYILQILLSKSPIVRREAAMKVPAVLSRRRVRRLLDAYRADPEGRYYVVAHWLDLGLAFSPKIARDVAKAKF